MPLLQVGQGPVASGKGSFAQMMNSQASQEHLSSQGAGHGGAASSQPLTQNLGLSMTPTSQPLSQDLSQVSAAGSMYPQTHHYPKKQ